MTVSRALGVGPSDNYFPDSRSRYGESSIANFNGKQTSQWLLFSVPPHPGPMQSPWKTTKDMILVGARQLTVSHHGLINMASISGC